MRHALKLHPDSRCQAVTGITVEVARPSLHQIDLRYVATGGMAGIRIPHAADNARRDELWRHTCFEAFLREAAGEAYVEFNFSPSTEYAGYGFSAYRQGMAPTTDVQSNIDVQVSATRLELRTTLLMQPILQIRTNGLLRLALTAIIEETSGQKSYWALAHPQGKPDFHHIDGFALDIPAAG